MTKIRKKPNILNTSKNKVSDANKSDTEIVNCQEGNNSSNMVHVPKKEKFEEDFIPFQQTFVNVTLTKKEESHNVLDFSESDPLNTHNFKPKSSGRKKKHFCSKCSASYRAKHELTDHIKSIHKGLKPYNCSICHSKFSYLRNLRYHEKTAHEK